MLHGSVNILNSINNSTNDSEGHIQNKEMIFCPELQQFCPKNIKLDEFDNVSICLDTSGSTNNIGGRSNRGTNTQFSSGITKTKPIYIAEMEGLSHMLVYLANNFDLHGKHFKIGSFDSKCNIAFDKKLESNKEIYDFATVLESKLVKTFSSTNLTEAIADTVVDYKKNTLLIILSDGRPDDAMSVIEKMDYITNQFKKNNNKLYVFTVGAGSISDSIDGMKTSYSCRGFRNTGYNNNSALNSLKSSGGECDKKFLEFTSEKGFLGSYVGTYGDYSDLKNGFSRYIEHIQKFKELKQKSWYININNNLIELSPKVQQCMENLRLSGRDYTLIFDEQRGYYIYSYGDGSEPYQIHVEPVLDYNSEIEYVPDATNTVCFLENITIDEKQHFVLYSTVYDIAKFTNVVFVAINPDNTRLYFRPDIVHSYYRVRRLF